MHTYIYIYTVYTYIHTYIYSIYSVYSLSLYDEISLCMINKNISVSDILRNSKQTAIK